MTTDHMRIFSAAEVEQIIARHREDATSGMLIGLCAAAISGAAAMLIVMMVVNRLT